MLYQHIQRRAGRVAVFNAAFGERLPLPAGSRVWGTQQDRAGAALRLAREAWGQGRGVPPEQALPVYLRDKVALTTAERLASGGKA